MLRRASFAATLALSAAIVLSACGGAAPAATPAAGAPANSTLSTSAASTPDSPASASPAQGAATDCVPAEVGTAGIPIVGGQVVCDLVRGSIADADLSIVVAVPSVDGGFAAASAALQAAGYTAGVLSPDGSDFTNGTYSVLVTAGEQAPYGPVVTYAISPA